MKNLKLRLSVLKLSKICAIIFVVSCIISICVSAYGYNVQLDDDGFTFNYEFIYDDESSTMSVESVATGEIERTMKLQMNFLGSKVYQGGSWLNTNTMERISRLYTPYVTGYNLLNVYSTDLPNQSYLPGSSILVRELAFAKCSFQTSFPTLELSGNVKFSLKYYTLLPRDYSDYISDELLSDLSTMYLTVYDGSGSMKVITLYPTYTVIDDIYPGVDGNSASSSDQWYYYQVNVDYVLSIEDFNYSFDKIYCNLITYVGRSYDTTKYWQQQIYVDNVRLSTYDPEIFDQVVIGNLINDDLITKLGVVNVIDQERMSVQKVRYDRFDHSVSELSSSESSLIGGGIDNSSYDTPDIVSDNGAPVSLFWSIFFGDMSSGDDTHGFNSFMREVVSAVVVIAGLSLIIFGAPSIISKFRGDG